MSELLAKYSRITNWQRRLWVGDVQVCTVEVRHSSMECDGRTINLWSLYGHVYPPHRLFGVLSLDTGRYELECLDPPLHCGISLYRVHYGGGPWVSSVQFGCDYDHLCDDWYRGRGVDSPRSFLLDAEQLADWLVKQHEGTAEVEVG